MGSQRQYSAFGSIKGKVTRRNSTVFSPGYGLMLHLISRAGVPPIHWNRGMSQAAGTAWVSCRDPPLGNSLLHCLLQWPSKGSPALFWEGLDSAEEPQDSFPSVSTLHHHLPQTGLWLWLGPGLVLVPVMLSETSLTSDSCQGPLNPS